MKIFRNFNDRYTQLFRKYNDPSQWQPPMWISVQGTERSMRGGATGTITTDVANGTTALLVRTNMKKQILRSQRTEEGKRLRKENNGKETFAERVLTPRTDGCSNTLTGVEKDNLLMETDDDEGFRIRKVTPRECFRLMGVSERDIDTIQAAGISKSQQYKMAGNSIVVDCLFHIFRKMFIETGPDHEVGTQLTLF